MVVTMEFIYGWSLKVTLLYILLNNNGYLRIRLLVIHVHVLSISTETIRVCILIVHATMPNSCTDTVCIQYWCGLPLCCQNDLQLDLFWLATPFNLAGIEMADYSETTIGLVYCCFGVFILLFLV